MHDIARDSSGKQPAMIIEFLPRHHDDDQEHDDMTPEFFMIATISLSATFVAATNASLDMLAIPGAMLAAFVAYLKAHSEKKDWTQKGITVVGTSVVGSTAPSAAIHWWWPDAMQKMTWQFFWLAGFFFGLVGWVLAWTGFLIVDRRKDKLMQRAIEIAEKKLGTRIDPDDLR